MIRQCHSFEDKLPAYTLLARSESLLLSCREILCLHHLLLTNVGSSVLIDTGKVSEAYILCYDVLSQLGENIPESMQPHQITEQIDDALKLVRNISSEKLLKMKEMDERHSISMNFFIIMGSAAFFVNPILFQYISCRMVQLTMKHGLCKQSMMGLAYFAMLFGNMNRAKEGVEIATRIGKAAISCLKDRYHASEHLANFYFVYYGIIAPHTEPLQTCADMLRQGFDAGMSLGDSDIAFFNSIHHIRTLIMAGERLPTLSEKVKYYLKMAKDYNNSTATSFLSLYLNTVTILTDNGEISNSADDSNDLPTNNASAKLLGSIYFQRAVQSYWRGHMKRCQFYTEKYLENVEQISFYSNFMVFIHGLSSFELMKRNTTTKLRRITKKSIRKLRTASSFSSWNAQNKVSTSTSRYLMLLVPPF